MAEYPRTLKKKRKFKPLRSAKDFIKYPRTHMKKDTLYKAKKHKKQKKLNLKKWFKSINSSKSKS